MLIELNIYWPTSDPEEDDTLRKKTEYEVGLLIVNSEHIVGYSPINKNETLMRLTNGDVFISTYGFDKFNELMIGIDVAKDMLIVDEN